MKPRFPLPVVAEAGTLQKTLRLDPIKRTSTSDFPKGKITVRTNRLPTRDRVGSVSLYYYNDEGLRHVCEIRPQYGWINAQNYGPTGACYSFTYGAIRKEDFDAFNQTVKMIDDLIESKMRGVASGGDS